MVEARHGFMKTPSISVTTARKFKSLTLKDLATQWEVRRHFR